MLLDELYKKREAILAAGRQYGARRIRVFGSVARGEEQPDSDIDFLVDLLHGYDMFTQRLPLYRTPRRNHGKTSGCRARE